MWLCKLFGHKYHQFADGMRALFCERCAYSVIPVTLDKKKEPETKLMFDGFMWHKVRTK